MSLLVASAAAAAAKRRKIRQWASELTRGKVGGDYGMSLLDPASLYDNQDQAAADAYHTSHDPGELAYVRNPELWCNARLFQLTSLVVFKDECADRAAAGTRWRCRFGGVAITRRHVVYCAHAHAWARDTWPPALGGCIADTRLRFLDVDGAAVDKVQLHQAEANTLTPATPANGNGTSAADICVAVMDEDLPESIYVPRVAPSNFVDELKLYERLAVSQEWQPWSNYFYSAVHFGSPSAANYLEFRAVSPGEAGYGITVTIVMSGGGSSVVIGVVGRVITVTIGSATTAATLRTAINAYPAASALIGVFPYGTGGTSGIAAVGSSTTTAFVSRPSDYHLLNRQLLHVMTGDAGFLPSPPAPAFAYSVWPGDSGTPAFSELEAELVFRGLVGADDSDTHPRGGMTWPDRLNALIGMADANAVEMGRMAAPTGYTVEPYGQSPTLVTSPEVSLVGSDYVSSPGVWLGGPVLTYRWFLNDTEVVGETEATYAGSSADGDELYCEVTGTNRSGFVIGTSNTFVTGDVSGVALASDGGEMLNSDGTSMSL